MRFRQYYKGATPATNMSRETPEWTWEQFDEYAREDDWEIIDEVCYTNGVVVVFPSGNKYDVDGAARCCPNFHEDAWKSNGFSIKPQGDSDAGEMQQIVDTTVYDWQGYGGHERTNDWVWKSTETWYVQCGWKHA